MKIKIKKLDERAIIPEYKTTGSAGIDLNILLDNESEILKKNEIRAFKTGLSISLPDGFEAQIRSRSGLSLKNGIIILNAPGTIDSDYRGEICLITMNVGENDFVVENGMRLGQMVITRYERCEFEETKELDETIRNEGAFGSTGVKNEKNTI